MNDWVCITQCTPQYAKYARKLVESGERVGVDVNVFPIEEQGNWQANVRQRWFVSIPQALERHEGRRILVLDADALFCRYPHEIEDLDCDLAMHRKMRCRWQPRCGTMLFGNTEAARSFVKDMQAACDAVPLRQRNDHIMRSFMERGFPRGLRVEWLPDSMCYIERLDSCEDPAVLHTQASRTMKRVLNG